MENNVDDRMNELLVKYLMQEASAEEQRAVEAWMNASPGNQNYFLQFRKIWESSQALANGLNINETQAWERFQQRIATTSAKQTVKKKKYAWRVAAATLIIAGTATMTYFLTGNREPSMKMMAVTTQNNVLADTLPDGSVATLNKHSTIQYLSAFKEKERKVHLSGEAFFHVTPNKKQPFIISVNDVQVRVLGTSFNVKSNDKGTEVIVESGIVQVTKKNEVMELHAGERLLLPAGEVAVKDTSSDKLYSYYVSRSFVCDNTPLWKLVDKLNEAYGVNIIIQRKELRKLPLTVTFDEESLDTILDIIRQTLLVKISREGNEVIIN